MNRRASTFPNDRSPSGDIIIERLIGPIVHVRRSNFCLNFLCSMEVRCFATDFIFFRRMASTKHKTTMIPKTQVNPISICDLCQYLKEHKIFRTILPTNGLIFRCDGDAPAPSKDYGQLEIHLDKVCFLTNFFPSKKSS